MTGKRRAMVSAATAVLSVVLVVSLAGGAGAAKTAEDVRVVNGTDEPIPTSVVGNPSVQISGTPTVSVANTPTVSLAHQPAQVLFTDATTSPNTCIEIPFPQDQRFLLERITVGPSPIDSIENVRIFLNAKEGEFAVAPEIPIETNSRGAGQLDTKLLVQREDFTDADVGQLYKISICYSPVGAGAGIRGFATGVLLD